MGYVSGVEEKNHAVIEQRISGKPIEKVDRKFLSITAVMDKKELSSMDSAGEGTGQLCTDK